MRIITPEIIYWAVIMGIVYWLGYKSGQYHYDLELGKRNALNKLRRTDKK